MSKRNVNTHKDRPSPAKRPKLDITKTSDAVQHQQQTIPVETVIEDDMWGTDLEEDDLSQIDLIVSQAVNTSNGNLFSQLSKPSNQKYGVSHDPKLSTNGGTLASKEKLPINRQLLSNKPSTSFAPPGINIGFQKNNVLITKNQNNTLPSRQLASSSDDRELLNDSLSSSQFQNNLIAVPGLNSTFHHTNYIVSIHDKDPKIQELEEKCEKLSNECTTKDGEITYLRKQISTLTTKIDNERMAKLKYEIIIVMQFIFIYK